MNEHSLFAGYDISFIELYKAAIIGTTSTPYIYDRGNKLKGLLKEFDDKVCLFQAHICKDTLPYSLNVSWEHNLPELRECLLNYTTSRRGPHNIVSIVTHVKPFPRSSYREQMAHVLARSLTYEFCKIRVRVPHEFKPIDAIREIDDSDDFMYYNADNCKTGWREKAMSGHYFYISNKKVAFMLRVAFGLEFEDLTEA